jgi:hypothetical protein
MICPECGESTTNDDNDNINNYQLQNELVGLTTKSIDALLGYL